MRISDIQCRCGQRIAVRDVLHYDWYVRIFGPTLLYLKYRCSRCRRQGEKILEKAEEDDTLLRDSLSEGNESEARRFQTLGPITSGEERELQRKLAEPDPLRVLVEEFGDRDRP